MKIISPVTYRISATSFLLVVIFCCTPHLVYAGNCSANTASYYESAQKARVACLADRELMSCARGGGCLQPWYGGFYYYETNSIFAGISIQRFVYSYGPCPEGTSMEATTGECEAPPQIDDELKKNFGCKKDPCSPGASPAVGG